MNYFRNIDNDGIWHRGEVRSFEYLSYLSPPAGDDYANGETVSRKSIISDDGVFDEDNRPLAAIIDFPSGYSTSIEDIKSGGDYTWEDAAQDGLEVVGVELIEETDDGDWYKVTVKVSETAQLGRCDILHADVTGEYGEKYAIVDGLDKHILYVEGDLQTALGWAHGVIKSFAISGSTGNDDTYTTEEDGYMWMEYSAITDRTAIHLTFYVSSDVYDGYVADFEIGDAPI